MQIIKSSVHLWNSADTLYVCNSENQNVYDFAKFLRIVHCKRKSQSAFGILVIATPPKPEVGFVTTDFEKNVQSALNLGRSQLTHLEKKYFYFKVR